MNTKAQHTIHSLQCEMAELVHQEYQLKVYSLGACHSAYDEDNMQELKLTLGLLQSGVTCPSKQHKVQPLKHHGNRRL